MGRLTGHLKTVFHHKNLVLKYCFKAGIPWQGLKHDLSKFSPTEFIPSVKYYTDGKHSPTVEERKLLGYSSAWLHHKGRNRHHFEYWIEFNWKNEIMYKCPMPLKYVKEMFCDRLAATKTYLKDRYDDFAPLEYYLARDERKFMHEKTYTLLEILLVKLAFEGEESVFSYMKTLKNKEKND